MKDGGGALTKHDSFPPPEYALASETLITENLTDPDPRERGFLGTDPDSANSASTPPRHGFKITKGQGVLLTP